MMNSMRALGLTGSLLALAAGCGGGSGGGGTGGATTSADILLTDAPVDELLSFNILVQEVRLYDGAGERSENLLNGSMRVNLLSAATQLAWLVSKPVPAGTWHGIELRYDPLGVDARLLDGAPASVQVMDDRLAAAFAAPVVFAAAGYQRVVVDFDLAASLADGTGGFDYDLDPEGIATGDDDPATPIQIDSIVGRVKGVDQVNDLLSIEAWSDDDRAVLLGTLQVQLEPGDLLQDDEGAVLDLASFYAAIVPDATFIEVHGAMTAAGTIDATRVELDGGIGGGDSVVRIDAIVQSIDLGASTMEIVVAEVDKGYSLVAGAFGGSIPASFTVAWDVQTYFGFADGGATTAASVVAGAEVDLRFASFPVGGPWTAARVELEQEGAEYEGTVSNIDDLLLGGSFQITLPPNSPLILGGAVVNPLTIQLEQDAYIWLDTGTEPSASPEAIQVGQRVRASGLLSGGPAGAVVDASEARIQPGRATASAMIGTLDEGVYSVVAFMDEFDSPFGGSVLLDAELRFYEETIYEGDVSSMAELQEAIESDAAIIELRIEGIAAIGQNAIEVYEVDVRVD
ncbi:MAG: DUF4382 domain-containing protein [Planctomycetia bacterium]